MKTTVTIIIGIILVLHGIAKGEEPNPEEDYNFYSFNKTKTLCEQVESTSEQIKSQYLPMSLFFFQGVKNGFMVWDPNAVRLTPETSMLVNSDGYKAALYSCFGNDTLKRKAFSATIIGEDVVGHILGFSVWLVPINLLSRAFRVSKLAFAYPKFFKGLSKTFSTLNKVGLAGFIAYMGYNEYTDYKVRSEGSKRFEEFNEEMADATNQQAENSYVLLQDLLDETNQQLAQGHLSEKQKQALLTRKSILENRLKNRPRD